MIVSSLEVAAVVAVRMATVAVVAGPVEGSDDRRCEAVDSGTYFIVYILGC